MSTIRYRCERCGDTSPLSDLVWKCAMCGGALELTSSGTIAPSDINRSDHSLWRYQAALPVAQKDAVALGAGMTPLVPGTLAGHDVLFKLDSLLPTGSFKDRGAAVMVAYLSEVGANRLIIDSSGNAAAAMAGLSAANGLKCAVFAPATTSPGKLVQSRAFGADVVAVDGSRDAVATAAQGAAENDSSAIYASHNWHPLFVEGVKTWALEVWEQLGFRTPATAWVPTGGGSAFVGAWRGFGATDQAMPRMMAAQPAACAPLVAAYAANADDVAPVEAGATLAEGTKIGAPARGRQMLQAIRSSGGSAFAVSEDEIKAALQDLWRQGLYVEPTAAVGAAAFRQAVASGMDLSDGDHVILLTGNGLKATETNASLLG